MNNPQELTEKEKKLLVQAQSQHPSGVGEVNAQFATQSGQDYAEIMRGSIGISNQEELHGGLRHVFGDWMTDLSEYAAHQRRRQVQQIMNDQINMQNELIDHTPLTVEQRIAQAVLDERERCARIAQDYDGLYDFTEEQQQSVPSIYRLAIAERIRSGK